MNRFRILSIALCFTVAIVVFCPEAYAGVDKINVHTGESGNAVGQFYSPAGIAFAENRGLLVAEEGGNIIRLITGSGAEIFAGLPRLPGGYVDGKAAEAVFNGPSALTVSGDGTVYLCDTENNLIRSIHGRFADTAAGNGAPGYAEGNGIAASFNKPSAIAASADGNIYIADTLNHCIRKMDAGGNVSLFAGTPQSSGNVDGPADKAKFFEPVGIAVDKNGTVYVADSANHSIRKIENGSVFTIAGKPGAINSETGYYAGGFRNGAEPLFNFPKGIALAEDGSLYVADAYNHSVRLVLPDGSVRTIIGNGEPGKLYGNYKNAKLSRPWDVALNGQTLYISDYLNDTVLEVTLDNEILKGIPARQELASGAGISAYSEELTVYFNKKPLAFTIKPVLTYEGFAVPLTEFFTAIGAAAVYDQETKAITVEKDGFKTVLINGEHFTIENGVSMLNVNTLINVFPYVTEWFPEYNVLIVEE